MELTNEKKDDSPHLRVDREIRIPPMPMVMVLYDPDDDVIYRESIIQIIYTTTAIDPFMGKYGNQWEINTKIDYLTVRHLDDRFHSDLDGYKNMLGIEYFGEYRDWSKMIDIRYKGVL